MKVCLALQVGRVPAVRSAQLCPVWWYSQQQVQNEAIRETQTIGLLGTATRALSDQSVLNAYFLQLFFISQYLIAGVIFTHVAQTLTSDLMKDSFVHMELTQDFDNRLSEVGICDKDLIVKG